MNTGLLRHKPKSA